MANLFPFQGIRYNPKRIQNLSKVVSPPYDVISEGEQDRCYRTSPYNIIRLELGRKLSGDNGIRNRYTRARRFFERWVEEGILLRDREPSLYIYEQRYKKGKGWVGRLGFIALLELEARGNRSIYPHEKTFPSPKEDRFLLLNSLRANVSPLFFLFMDRKKEAEKMMKSWIHRHTPFADVRSETVRHRMWRLTHPFVIRRLCEITHRNPLFIADGHHRYEVALTFWKRRKRGEGNFVMAYFSNLQDAHLTILPIHRLVKGLPGHFDIFQRKLSSLFTFEAFSRLSQVLEAMEKGRGSHVFGMYWKDKPFYLLTLKNRKALSEIDKTCHRSKTWRRLDVTVLHELVFKKRLGLSESALRRRVLYHRDVHECIRRVRQGDYQAAFFLRAPHVQQIRRIALARERIPQKSTYFYPKPLTGLVLYRFGR